MRVLIAGTCLAVTLALVSDSKSPAQDKKDEPKYTIAQVMTKAHKGGLLAKITSGKASKEEATELLTMYESLAKQKPPAGDQDSWKMKTEALVSAAKLIVDGDKDKGVPALKKAADCKGCHGVHKGA
jgi:hypothetical protein